MGARVLGEMYSSVQTPAGNLSERFLTQSPSQGRGELTERDGKGRGEEGDMVLAPPPPRPRYRERAGPLGFGLGVAPVLGRLLSAGRG